MINSSYVNPLRHWVRGLTPVRYLIMQGQPGAALRGRGGGVAWWRGVARRPQQKKSDFFILIFKINNARANRAA